MTPAEKKELISFLKRGDKKQICKLAGVHETVMYAWISGRLKTSCIEPYVIQLAQQRRKEFEEQTGNILQEQLIDSEIIINENLKLKAEIQLNQREIHKYRKLISGKNKVCQQLFSSFKKYLSQGNGRHVQKKVLLEKLEHFQADFSFLKQYEKYADILNTVNPVFSKTLDKLHHDITYPEKQLLSMIKLHLSYHEIAVILATSDEVVADKIALLRQKLNLPTEENIADFFNAC